MDESVHRALPHCRKANAAQTFELPTDDMSELNEELGAEVRSLREIVEVNARPGQRSRDTFVKSTRRDSCF
jgi:hypothetical protein